MKPHAHCLMRVNLKSLANDSVQFNLIQFFCIYCQTITIFTSMSMHFHSMICFSLSHPFLNFFATTMARVKRFKTGLQKPVGDITVDASIFTTVYDLESFSSAVGKSHFKALLLSCTGPFQRITWLSSANACWP